jgi:exonuclease SbcC
MRILQVRFRNLNSLVGEWSIDLTQAAYVSDGIFAITGPTGAGKTTILDAICLGLYGRTPRLNKVSKSVNEVMSRHTGECFAEVTFETHDRQNGLQRWRCHWSQHRARRKANGELQNPKHEISNADSGEICETKIRGVAEQIEATTGMDFERFTRSMLLAQGGFDTFLKAEADRRAPILEQITGTEIYSQISIRVHERQREEDKKLGLLQAETAGIEMLDAEQEQAIRQALASRREQEQVLGARLAETARAINWLNTIAGLKREIDALGVESAQLQIDMQDFEPERQRLDRALSAASLDAVYATLCASRQQQQNDLVTLNAEQSALPGLQAAVDEKAALLQQAEQQTATAREALQFAIPVLRQMRALDQQITAQGKLVAQGETDCAKDAEGIRANETTRDQEKEKRGKANQALQTVEVYRVEHARDERLVAELAGIEARLNELMEKDRIIQRKSSACREARTGLHKAKQSLEHSRRQTALCEEALGQASRQFELGKQRIQQLLEGRQLRAYRSEREALHRERVLLARIAELETQRASLRDGEVCPLCGATHHPYAEGNVPEVDAYEHKIETLTRLIDSADAQEDANRSLEQAENEARNKLAEARLLETSANNAVQSADKMLADLDDEFQLLQTDFEGRRQAVSDLLLDIGISEVPQTDMSVLLKDLNARRDNWLGMNRDKAQIEKQLADIDSELKSLNALIDNQSGALIQQRNRLDGLKKDLADEQTERQRLYGDKDPDVEDVRLQKARSAAEQAQEQARVSHAECQQQAMAAQTRIGSLQDRIDSRTPQLAGHENEFSEALALLEFGDERAFQAARLSADERDGLMSRGDALSRRQTELDARKKDRESRLSSEQALQLTDQPLEVLEPRHRQLTQDLDSAREIITGITLQLKNNDQARARYEKKQVAIEAQQRECRRWLALHELIGSADGKKYRNFAQGLTFEMMIGHANRQLQKMTERYLLLRDDVQPLELNVIDNYQAGEIRSTKNLSGGEAFIVSLALALGLSQMASHNVRVDSLFLDEGFGTLDDEALDTALETLAGLQQEGKLIGVISHVQALKERIATQIQVTPDSGGRSRLSGPGCVQLAPA